MKTKTLVGGALLFVGVFAVTLVTRTPLASLQPRMPSMLQDTEQFDGSILNGSVKHLGTTNGPVDLQWKLKPLKLLTGKVGGDVEFDWLQASGNGQMAVSAGKVAYISDTIVTSPAALIETFLPFVRFGGKLRLQLDDGSASQTSYGPFNGELTWKGATVNVTEQAVLGDIKLVLSEDGDATTGVLSSSGGEVSLKGDITLQTDGAYTADITARLEPSASQMVKSSLPQVAKRQNDGSFRIQQSGSLSDLM